METCNKRKSSETILYLYTIIMQSWDLQSTVVKVKALRITNGVTKSCNTPFIAIIT
jgi:hypothetical protein